MVGKRGSAARSGRPRTRAASRRHSALFVVQERSSARHAWDRRRRGRPSGWPCRPAGDRCQRRGPAAAPSPSSRSRRQTCRSEIAVPRPVRPRASRARDGVGGSGARPDICHRDAGLGRIGLAAGDGQGACLGLDQEVIGPSGGTGTSGTVAADVDGDELECLACAERASNPSRCAAPGARFCTKASASARIRSSAAASSGALRSSTTDCLPRFAHAKCADVPSTSRRSVGRSRRAARLYLDHSCPEVGQLPRAVRRRYRLLDGDDEDAVSRLHCDPARAGDRCRRKRQAPAVRRRRPLATPNSWRARMRPQGLLSCPRGDGAVGEH